jgi:5-methylthioadenosine/S-adenosylhomocysteine deaminase
MKELLIRNGTLVTMDAANTIISDGALLIRDGRIAAIGRSGELAGEYPATPVFDAKGKAVLPGLIDAHTHIAMVPFRGLIHDRRDILYNVVWPVETSLTAEDCYHLARLGALEALKAGVTCVADHYFFMDSIAAAVAETGIRGYLGQTVMEMGGPLTGKDQLASGFAFFEKWRDRHERIVPVLAPHAPDTVSPVWLREMKAFAAKRGTVLHLHLAQTKWEVRKVRELYGKTPVRLLRDEGILGPEIVAAHCIYLDDAEITMMAAAGAGAVYCPSTHAFSGKIAPVIPMLDKGVRVGIGTDYVAENDDRNLLEEMRLATMLQKVVSGDPEALPTGEVVNMAARINPSLFGAADRLGTLEAGKAADIIILNLDTPRMVPLTNTINNIVYAASEADIETVLVGGDFVIRDRVVLSADEAEIIAAARRTCASLLQRALTKQPALQNYLDRHVYEAIINPAPKTKEGEQ